MAVELERKLRVGRRLRPLRLAFLVEPEDMSALEEVFEINTSLWGGQFNLIVPVYRQRPRRWDERLTAREFVSSYVQCYEPDYVVAMKPSLAKGIPIPESRVLTPGDVIPQGSTRILRYGLSIDHILNHLYSTELRFYQRYPSSGSVPYATQPEMAQFIAACFGKLPLGGTGDLYRFVLNAQPAEVTPTNLLPLLDYNQYPLKVGAHSVLAYPVGDVGLASLMLFFMDTASPLDLADFWNLRAIGCNVVPIPRSWATSLIEPTGSKLTAQDPTKVILVASRSVTQEEARDLGGKLLLRGGEHLDVVAKYPRIWDKNLRREDRIPTYMISAGEADQEIQAADGWVTVNEISPSFAPLYGGGDQAGWANVVSFYDVGSHPDATPVIPPDLVLPDDMCPQGTEVWVTSEGIVTMCKRTRWSQSWPLPTSLRVFGAWMKPRSNRLELSDAGRIVSQVVRFLGGLPGLSAIADEGTLQRLLKMAGGRNGRPKALPVQRWVTELSKTEGGPKARQHLEFLVRQRVLTIGLLLRCNCTYLNWFDLESLGPRLTCERCLQQFDFPAAHPPEKGWAYRTLGPFSQPNLAQGAYSVGLAARFLIVTLWGNGTWIPSFNLELEGKPLEVDLAMFWQPVLPSRKRDPVLLMAECKSFNDFAPDDVQRMKQLARMLPGAIVAFCTLRKSLKPAEIRLLSSTVRTLNHNPVLVLTGVELLGHAPPPQCWTDLGITTHGLPSSPFPPHVTELCRATQQVHLGMATPPAFNSA